MSARPPRRRMLITSVGMYLVFAAAAARAMFEIDPPSELPYLIGLLAVYLLLLLIEPQLVARSLVTLHIINALQVGITLALLLFVGSLDFYALLFIPPCIQSIQFFPQKTALRWIGAIVLMMVAALLIKFPMNESIGYVIIYPAAIFLFTSLCYLAKQAEEAQNRSESLLLDLQMANQKLQAYAAQVQELAATNERNRLARELHDSVTQTIFGLTLSAQAARILIDRNPQRAATELDHLQVLAQNALAEMRALIQHLHPHSNTEEGLAPALRRLAAERSSNDSLTVDLQIHGERRLPASMEAELFRIAQEALNNVAKHAQTGHALLTLDLQDQRRVKMVVADNGVGFDPEQARSQPGHMGLASMIERVQSLGGTLTIDSKPGQGTRLWVEIILEQEVVHA